MTIVSRYFVYRHSLSISWLLIAIYFSRDFVVELKKSLSCVLDRKTPSSKDLDKCIDLIGQGMEKRLDLTSEYIEILNRIEVVNDSYNNVSY